ncbi:hypothetical protein TNCV_2126941 [Trichonephila clavipes]|nr:hypothetical protein TNCV_2126941 [Trichonephila clavipes]
MALKHERISFEYFNFLPKKGGLATKVPDSRPACYEFEPSTTEDLPCRGWVMHVKSIEAETFSRGCGSEEMAVLFT